MSTLIIAEAGVNHNGELSNAIKLIDEAKRAGADIVKFQTFEADKLASKNAEMAIYQKENLGTDQSQRTMLQKLMLKQEEYRILADHCRMVGIEFLSTPFDISSIHFLDGIVNIWKIPSGEITNYPYLVEIAKTGKNVILSTGMSTMNEVDAALNVLKSNGAGKISLLHCTTNYPTPMEDVNLNAMLTMREHCHCEVGYSDHTKGIEVAIAAVAMGASIIEKHFTLDRTMEGPDHAASLEPYELKQMIDSIRNIELALGNGQKAPSKSELINIGVVRKSIVAARNIKAGEFFTADNLTTKRPGTGINPMRWNEIIGTKSTRNYSEDDLIEE